MLLAMSDPRDFLLSHAAASLPAQDAAFLAGALLRRCTAPVEDLRRGIGLDDMEIETLVRTCFPSLAVAWHPGTCVARHVCGLCEAEMACHGIAPTADYGRFSSNLLLGEETDLRFEQGSAIVRRHPGRSLSRQAGLRQARRPAFAR